MKAISVKVYEKDAASEAKTHSVKVYEKDAASETKTPQKSLPQWIDAKGFQISFSYSWYR